MFEIRTYTWKQNLVSGLIGGALGLILAFCNPVNREALLPLVHETVDVEPIDISGVKHKSRAVLQPFVEESPRQVEIQPLISLELTEVNLAEEAKYDDMELIAQLVQAEAGNQDLEGRRLVTSVVLNRVRSDQFPNTVEDVIFQDGQFSVIKNGMFDEAGWHMDELTYQAVELEMEEQMDTDILFFSRGRSEYMNTAYKHQDHWFGY